MIPNFKKNLSEKAITKPTALSSPGTGRSLSRRRYQRRGYTPKNIPIKILFFIVPEILLLVLSFFY